MLSKALARWFTVVGVAGLAPLAGALAARYSRLANRYVLICASALPVSAGVGPICAALLALAGHRRLGGAAAALSAAALATQVRSFGSNDPDSAGPDLTVMSVNVWVGRADAESLVSAAAARAAVLAVQELTAEALARLSAAGIDEAFPHRLVDARPEAAGIGLWSVYPISQTREIGGFCMPALAVRLRVPGVSIDPTVVVAHLESPLKPGDWNRDIGALAVALGDADSWAAGGSVIVAGDFNSTLDMRGFREALPNGYCDATEQARAGFKPTWPDTRWTPPLFAIDHVLTRRCRASSVYTAPVAASDHRALVARVHLPPTA